MERKRLLIVVNVDWFFLSHRLPIAEKAIQEGWDVTVLSQDTGKAKDIIKKGIHFYNVSFSRSGTNLLNEFKTVFTLYRLYKKLKVDVVHQVTLKPVIYGSLVSKLLKIKGTVNAISGLGYNFTEGRRGVVQKIMLRLMKFGFKQNNLAVVFQNDDDLNQINELSVLEERNMVFLIKGSGVDLVKYEEEKFIEKEKIEVLFPARMLKDKGVEEFIGAAEMLKKKYKYKVKFILAGKIDIENKAGISEEYLKEKLEESYIEWIGFQENMIDVYKKSDIVVLPSYREGMPKALIEACAIGRPIITTNAIGCKECVDEGVNGYKVPVKSVKELGLAIEKLVQSSDLRKEMGRHSRLKAEKEFSLTGVVSKHIEIYTELFNA